MPFPLERVPDERPREPDAARAPTTRAAPVVIGVVPCYDVVATCADVVRAVAGRVDRVIAVDDGSRDGTGEALAAVAGASGGRVEVLVHPENRGKGEALLRAFRHALDTGPCDVVVTVDGDGQHDASCLDAVVAPCLSGAALSIGTRTGFRAMPWKSRFGNTLTSAVLRVLRPGCPPDTQSGFRAHARAFVERVVEHVVPGRYETELCILLLALDGGPRVATVEIPTVYVDGNAATHFRPLADGLRIYRALAARLVRRGRRRGHDARRPGGAAGSAAGPGR